MTVVEVPGEPRAGYARAVLGLLSRRRGTDLPDRTYSRRGVTPDPDRLARYDRVCGFRLTGTLPGTYPHVLAFPPAMRLMSAPDFPFPVVGLVHVAGAFTVHRPIDAGTPLDVAVHATGLRPHNRGRQFDVVATATADGAEVWRGVSTYLKKERGGDRRDRPDPPVPPPASARWRIAPRVGTDYAAVSGDRNPIHTSRLGARVFGFPRPIAHGMWSAARCLAALDSRLPPAYTVDVAFKLPILLPATVDFAAVRFGGGWDFALHAAGTGRPHLTGHLRPIPTRP